MCSSIGETRSVTEPVTLVNRQTTTHTHIHTHTHTHNKITALVTYTQAMYMEQAYLDWSGPGRT